jgi:hypothetical protein
MKIAIVKLSALGDIVHAMAALQFIKAQLVGWVNLRTPTFIMVCVGVRASPQPCILTLNKSPRKNSPKKL